MASCQHTGVKMFLMICFLSCLFIDCHSQQLALKNNLVYSALAVPNIGIEYAANQRLTIDVSGLYNPFQQSETKKWKLWMVQPGMRYWLCRNFAGNFVGTQLMVGQFNVGGISLLPSLNSERFQGNFLGGGFSFGRHIIISPRWGVEAEAGFGFARMWYDRFVCVHCGEMTGREVRTYFSPTRFSLSLVYMIK